MFLEYSLCLSSSSEFVIFLVKQEAEEKQKVLQLFFEFFKDFEELLRVEYSNKSNLDSFGSSKLFYPRIKEVLITDDSSLKIIYKFLKDHNFEFLQRVFNLEFELEVRTNYETEYKTEKSKEFEEEKGIIKRHFKDRG